MEADSSPQATPASETAVFDVSLGKEHLLEASEAQPKQNEKTWLLLSAFFEQLHKNPTALASFAMMMKKQLNKPASTQPLKPKEQPAKLQQKKPRKKNNVINNSNEKKKKSLISHSRSWDKSIIKTKEPPLKSYYEKRQHIIINPAEIRRIHTPDWIESDTENYQIIPILDFDMEKAHLRLEICENRIIRGTDDRFLHPACAIEKADIDGELVLSPNEEEKLKNYKFVEVKQMTPLFWPARSWDKPETTLNQVQSDKLFSEVKTITDITQSLDIGKYFHSKPSNSSKVKRSNTAPKTNKARNNRKIRDSTLTFSIINYLTDDSDFTDLEDF